LPTAIVSRLAQVPLAAKVVAALSIALLPLGIVALLSAWNNYAALVAVNPHIGAMHALGVGQPENVRVCYGLGYEIFDSALPTRDARNGRMYVWKTDPENPDFSHAPRWYDSLYIDDDKHIKDDRPFSPHCDCLTCTRYSVGYLRHLHKANDTLYYRLATLHNLRFMTQLMNALRLPAPAVQELETETEE